MRRAQSLRNHNARSSAVSLTDDLGALKEQNEESTEDALTKKLLAAERENDKLKAQILSLQDQLTQRPPLERVQELEREYKNLELLLLGTQRENERCMAELERYLVSSGHLVVPGLGLTWSVWLPEGERTERRFLNVNLRSFWERIGRDHLTSLRLQPTQEADSFDRP
ncbi:hypothetical protein A7U60_g5772 [Sanghuangporus baumii]|uniref:Uncharacterized protein n=1 Tax=Sanghuangporus baumii TaxID=108892 RepID=A0A9Q5HWF7_SANBA|nr:hypothetical protein A7U60_g5772 [Sanghuangporus baumii]